MIVKWITYILLLTGLSPLIGAAAPGVSHSPGYEHFQRELETLRTDNNLDAAGYATNSVNTIKDLLRVLETMETWAFTKAAKKLSSHAADHDSFGKDFITEWKTLAEALASNFLVFKNLSDDDYVEDDFISSGINTDLLQNAIEKIRKIEDMPHCKVVQTDAIIEKFSCLYANYIELAIDRAWFDVAVELIQKLDKPEMESVKEYFSEILLAPDHQNFWVKLITHKKTRSSVRELLMHSDFFDTKYDRERRPYLSCFRDTSGLDYFDSLFTSIWCEPGFCSSYLAPIAVAVGASGLTAASIYLIKHGINFSELIRPYFS